MPAKSKINIWKNIMKKMENKKVLIISVGPVPINANIKVEGGGLRAWGLAQGLIANGVDVTIAIPDNFELEQEFFSDNLRVCKWDFENLKFLFDLNDAVYVLYSRGDLMKYVASNLDPKKQLIVDLYVPIYIESLARELKGTLDEYQQYQYDLSHWNTAFSRGDYFLCANQSQYHFYNGVLSAMGRINPITFKDRLLEVVPYGIHNSEIVHDKDVCRGVMIEKNDFMILWFGGLYPWFDIAPLLDAVKELSGRYSDIKLVVLGGKNPFSVDKQFTQQYDFAVSFAKENNLFEKNIFFVDWIPYDERNNWYMESDVVINLHHKTKETIYSWRTRIVDFIWGEMPIISTGGDEATEYLAKNNASIILENNDAQEIKSVIEKVHNNRDLLIDMKNNMKLLKAEFYWDFIVKNMAEFIKVGNISSDRALLLKNNIRLGRDENNVVNRKKSILYYARTAFRIFQERGFSSVIRKIKNTLAKNK